MAKSKTSRRKPADSQQGEIPNKKEEELIVLPKEDDDDDDSLNTGSNENEVTKESAATKQTKPRKGKKKSSPENSSVVYIGHLPDVLSEDDLQTLLQQFGIVKNIRISRSNKTGRSRGFAFCALASPKVASIVADTLSGYLLFDAKQHVRKRLVCHIVPPDKLHAGLFLSPKPAGAVSKPTESHRLPKTLSDAKEQTNKLVGKEKTKRKKLQAMGIEYEFPGYSAAATVSPEKVKEEAAESSSSTKKKKKKDKAASPASAANDEARSPNSISITADKTPKDPKTPKTKMGKNESSTKQSETKQKSETQATASESKLAKKRKNDVKEETEETPIALESQAKKKKQKKSKRRKTT